MAIIQTPKSDNFVVVLNDFTLLESIFKPSINKTTNGIAMAKNPKTTKSHIGKMESKKNGGY